MEGGGTTIAIARHQMLPKETAPAAAATSAKSGGTRGARRGVKLRITRQPCRGWTTRWLEAGFYHGTVPPWEHWHLPVTKVRKRLLFPTHGFFSLITNSKPPPPLSPRETPVLSLHAMDLI